MAEVRYMPWGETRYASGTTPTTFRFTGQREDVSTAGGELYFFRARTYDPVVGRFLSADSIVPEPGNPQALNRYSYVLGNPTKYTDPSGHREDDGCGGVAGGCSYGPMDYYWNALAAQSYCEQPNTPGCTDYVELAAFTAVGLVGIASLPEIPGLVAAGWRAASDALLWLGAQCVAYSQACNQLLTGGRQAAETAVGGGGGATAEELAIAEQHLARIGGPAERAMLERLRQGYWTQWDQTFLRHEVIEASILPEVEAMMVNASRTEILRAAHLQTLAIQGIPYTAAYEATIFHPEVISAYPEYFNSAARLIARKFLGK